jgi:hypothetical protein
MGIATRYQETGNYKESFEKEGGLLFPVRIR